PRHGPHLRRARLQGGARRGRLRGYAQRPLDARPDHRTAIRDGARRPRRERHAPHPPARGMTPEALRELLAETKTIAVVGLSPKPWRPSHQVAQYLQAAGYRIVPVNPEHDTILGERGYPTLTAAAREHPIDIVDV